MAINILVIRKDNIGDLVCTTPMFYALRKHYPCAKIVALVNSYNYQVLIGNPYLDAVYVYTKAKHKTKGQYSILIWLKTLFLVAKLRMKRWDYSIVAGTSFSKSAIKFAKGVKSKRVIAFSRQEPGVTDPIPPSLAHGLHEVEALFALLSPLKIYMKPGYTFVAPPHKKLQFSEINRLYNKEPIVGIHISSRKISQRWEILSFVRLAYELRAKYGVFLLVFWSPGRDDDSKHPGDDSRARRLKLLCGDIPLMLFKTLRLEELITGLSYCDCLICSDGGAMHLAAGLGKPIVCMFGDSSSKRWHPWGVPYELLQKKSMRVADISVDEVLNAYEKLQQRLVS